MLAISYIYVYIYIEKVMSCSAGTTRKYRSPYDLVYCGLLFSLEPMVTDHQKVTTLRVSSCWTHQYASNTHIRDLLREMLITIYPTLHLYS